MKIIEKKLKEFPLCEAPIDYAYEEFIEFTEEDYKKRRDKLWKLEQAKGYDLIIIYGDREHFSNICYFTGYDPRWEESLLILKRNEKPILLVGNEGIGYSKILQAEIETEMYQNFSLMGQPNDQRSKTLTEIFRCHGVEKETRIGLIGWKYYDGELLKLKGLVSDVPYYIVKCLEDMVSVHNIFNATDLLSDCEYGLKHSLEAKEIVQFDLAGTKVSRGVYHFLKEAKEGMRETEAAEFLQLDGEPLNMHPNINFGDEHVKAGINSPKFEPTLKYGMLLSVGYGMRGSLVHRCGIYARGEEDIPNIKENYIEKLLKPYFACVATWYEMMKIGMPCKEIYQMVDELLGMEKFNISLNPGHLTHTDEWTNSPFTKDSKVNIRSGMAFQCDYTVTFNEPYMSAHVEDGLVVADEKLRNEIKAIAPTCYKRLLARQKFIREVLNINLPEEVLPLSDLSCVCYPYMADTSVVLAKEE